MVKLNSIKEILKLLEKEIFTFFFKRKKTRFSINIITQNDCSTDNISDFTKIETRIKKKKVFGGNFRNKHNIINFFKNLLKYT